MKHRKVLCDDQMGGMGRCEMGGRLEGGDKCMHIADSVHYTGETTTTL